MLSHPLDIVGLVSSYLTNYLVSLKPLPGRSLTFCSEEIIRYYLQFPTAIPVPGVRSLVLLPRLPLSTLRRKLLARLACLIHAANVHSEPGSNPSNVSRISHAAITAEAAIQVLTANIFDTFKSLCLPPCFLVEKQGNTDIPQYSKPKFVYVGVH